MDVSSIEVRLDPADRVARLTAARTDPALTGADSAFDLRYANASIVTLSWLSQLLIAVTVTDAQRQGWRQPWIAGPDALSNFSAFAASVNSFVDAYNNFQTNSTPDLSNPFESAFYVALQNALTESRAQVGTAAEITLIRSLASIGINYQSATTWLACDQFQVNWAKLESAFNAHPAETSALLSDAFALLSLIEGELSGSQTGPVQSLFASQFGLTSQPAWQAASTAALTTSGAIPALELATAAGDTLPTSPLDAWATTTAMTTATTTAMTTAMTTTTAASQTLSLETPTATSTAVRAMNTEPAALAVQYDVGPLWIDPLIANAVAVVRLGEAVASNRSDVRFLAPVVLDGDIAPIYKTLPVTLLS